MFLRHSFLRPVPHPACASISLVIASLVLLSVACAPAAAQSGYWDPRFGPPPLNNGQINALAVVGNDIYAGGTFGTIDGTVASRVARWDAARGQWVPLGSGLNRDVNDIAVANGVVYVAGNFTRAGDVPVRGIAAWNGSTWSAVGDTNDLQPGIFDYLEMRTLLVDGNALYVGGYFDVAGADRSTGLARFDLTTGRWSPVYGGVDSSHGVWTLAKIGERLFVGGYFNAVGPDDLRIGRLAQVDLTTGIWSSVGGWSPSEVRELLAIGPNLYVGGLFAASDRNSENLARWNTTAERWEKLDTGVGDLWRGVGAMHLVGDDLYVGVSWGSSYVGLRTLYRVNLRTDSVEALSPFPDNWISAMTSVADRLYVGGVFTTVGTVQTPLIAARSLADGTWSPLTSHRFLALNGPVSAILAPTMDRVFVGGKFTLAGFTRASNIAVWNGDSWAPLGGGVDGTVRAIGGDSVIFVGGDFVTVDGRRSPFLGRWDVRSQKWLTSTDTLDGPVHAIFVDGQRNVYIGGEFSRIGTLPANGVACWCDSRWTALRTSTHAGVDGTVRALAMIGPDLYVGGMFISAGGDESISQIARWSTTGKTWSAVGDGVDNAVTALRESGGSLIAVGPFTRAGDVQVRGVARWTGSEWSAIGGGFSGDRSALAVTTHGRFLVAGGGFRRTDTTTLNRLAGYDGERWMPIGGGVDTTVLALASVGADLYVGGEFRTAGGLASPYLAIWHGTAAAVPTESSGAERPGLSVSPLPVRDRATMILRSPRELRARLVLVDALGAIRAVLHDGFVREGDNALPLSTEGLPHGAYFVRAVCGAETVVLPIVIDRQ